MHLILLAVGSKAPAWINSGWADYLARFPRGYRVELIEIPLAPHGLDRNSARAQEGRALEKQCARFPQAYRIALDVQGKTLSTEDWAQHWLGWKAHGTPVLWMIGGPDGLCPTLLAQCQARWSLSALTFPHALVRLLWIEQCYRAHTLSINHPYHRA